MERLMTVAELAAYLNVSTKTVYRRVERGELQCYRIGSSIRFRRNEVKQALKGDTNAKKDGTRSRSYLAR